MISNFNKHYRKSYTKDNIPQTLDYDELIFILSYGLAFGVYESLPGKLCGDKANILLGICNYEIY